MNRHPIAWLASLLPAALLGCAHAPAPAPASAEELRALREEVRALRADREQDRRRLRAVEAVLADRSPASGESSSVRSPGSDFPAVRPDRSTWSDGRSSAGHVLPVSPLPDLAVVRLVPDASLQGDGEDDSFVFIADGGSGPSRPAESGRLAGRTGGPEAAPALPLRVALADPERSQAYEQGIAALEAGDPTEAIGILEGFVKRSPRDPRADNAILAVGDAWLALEKPGNALQAFERVVREFPAGDVVPEALLRYGETCRILGRESAAQAAFQRLVRDHPASIAATRAELHLAAR